MVSNRALSDLLGRLASGVPLGVEDCSGSGAIQTFHVHCYVKVGQEAEIHSEAAAYRKLASAAGDMSSAMFPTVTDPQRLPGGLAAIFIEPVVGETLETAILAIASMTERFGEGHANTVAQIFTVRCMIDQTLRHLARLRAGSTNRSSAELRLFVAELEAALRRNIAMGSLDVSIPALAENPVWWSYGDVCVAHRDCTVVNIIGNTDGVRFIDPRVAVPNGTVGAEHASPVLDLVSLSVSLERKQLELDRLSPGCRIPNHDELTVGIEGIVQDQGATPELCLLCEAVARSAYVACRCSYCLDPSRIWLYQHMVRTTLSVLAKLSPSS